MPVNLCKKAEVKVPGNAIKVCLLKSQINEFFQSMKQKNAHPTPTQLCRRENTHTQRLTLWSYLG